MASSSGHFFLEKGSWDSLPISCEGWIKLQGNVFFTHFVQTGLWGSDVVGSSSILAVIQHMECSLQTGPLRHCALLEDYFKSWCSPQKKSSLTRNTYTAPYPHTYITHPEASSVCSLRLFVVVQGLKTYEIGNIPIWQVGHIEFHCYFSPTVCSIQQ